MAQHFTTKTAVRGVPSLTPSGWWETLELALAQASKQVGYPITPSDMESKADGRGETWWRFRSMREPHYTVLVERVTV